MRSIFFIALTGAITVLAGCNSNREKEQVTDSAVVDTIMRVDSVVVDTTPITDSLTTR